jgi:hypothetical protein
MTTMFFYLISEQEWQDPDLRQLKMPALTRITLERNVKKAYFSGMLAHLTWNRW